MVLVLWRPGRSGVTNAVTGVLSDDRAVVLRHRLVGDGQLAPLSGSQAAPGIAPGRFLVSQLAEPRGALVPVVVEDGSHRLLLRGRECLRIPARPAVDHELAAVLPVELADDRPVRPRLDPRVEQPLLVPDQVPRVGVISQLLELHRRHRAPLVKDVRGNVMHSRHRVDPPLTTLDNSYDTATPRIPAGSLPPT